MTMNFKYNGNSLVLQNDLNILPQIQTEVLVNGFIKLTEKIDKFMKKYAVPISTFIGFLNMAKPVLAGTSKIAERLLPLISMVQDLALPIGIVVASWGLIEVIIGQPSGKEKIKYAIIGYVGMFLIPELFYAVRDAFAQ